jgi:hypothetical protein
MRGFILAWFLILVVNLSLPWFAVPWLAVPWLAVACRAVSCRAVVCGAVPCLVMAVKLRTYFVFGGEGDNQ